MLFLLIGVFFTTGEGVLLGFGVGLGAGVDLGIGLSVRIGVMRGGNFGWATGMILGTGIFQLK